MTGNLSAKPIKSKIRLILHTYSKCMSFLIPGKVFDSNIYYEVIRSIDNVPLYHFLTTSIVQMSLSKFEIDVTCSVRFLRLSINYILRHG